MIFFVKNERIFAAMHQRTSYLVIDAGNTRTKLALFLENELTELHYLTENELEHFAGTVNGISYDFAILSSVRTADESEFLLSKLKNGVNVRNLDYPIESAYHSPATLGMDRLANAVAIKHKAGKNCLAIDFGTCIKFDWVDQNGIYQGGSISPGIDLRYIALNQYTAALPLLDLKTRTAVLGQSTTSCIQSGVLNGIQGEIEHFMNYYEQKNPGLTIFVTGGDHMHFDYSSKKNIFADENLTLFGLLLILKANAK